MGPWPGLEPGLTGPQPIVLTATPPQPWKYSVDLRETYEAFHYQSVYYYSSTHRFEGESIPSILMARRSTAVLLCLMFLAVLLSPTAQAVTVVRADPVEMLDAGNFSDANDWTLNAERNDTEPAPHTSISIDDGSLIIEHDRPENTAETRTWASSSSTGSTAATGLPDGGVAISDGPDIRVDGFNFGSTTNNPLLNVSLVFVFEIPDTLQDDEVNFIIDRGDGPILIHTIRHTFQPTIYTESSPLIIEISDEDDPWIWTDVETLDVLIDYVSVNNFDDSQLELDAVAVHARHRAPWYAFETATAVHTTPPIDFPVLDFDSLDGMTDDLTIASCGLTPSSTSAGKWTIEDIERPYVQQWGRLHLSMDGNASVQIRESLQTGWISMNDGGLIPLDVDRIDVRVTILDGCVEGLRIDINDPMLTFDYTISGETTGLVSAISTLRVALEGALVEEIPITASNGTISAPVGHLLGTDGESLTIGIGARFQWSSDGDPEYVQINIGEMSINGAYVVEFDQDPICEEMDSQTFSEDEPGRYIPFRFYCTDDITAIDSLIVTATSSDSTILSSTVVNGELLLVPQVEQSGDVDVQVVVEDERGNQWIQTLPVSIQPVDDAPVLTGFVTSVYMEIGAPHVFTVSITDIDSDNLQVTTDIAWATATQSGSEPDSWTLTFAPSEPGQTFVEVSVDDGTTIVNRTIEIIATSNPDLTVESIDLIHADTTLTEPYTIEQGQIISIRVWVRNTGIVEANGVDVECQAGDASLPGDTIATIQPGGLDSIVCNWSASGEGDIIFFATADSNGLIDETDENNNDRSITISITKVETNPGEGTSSDTESRSLPIVMLLSILIGGGAVVLYVFSPSKIQRTHQLPTRRPKNRR